MNGPAFRLALRHSARTVAIVAVALGFFYWVVLLSSSSFLGDPNQPLPPFVTDPPRAMRAFLGGSANFLSPTSWLSSGMLHPIVLSLTTIAAFVVVSGTGATEIERGTIDLVLSRPVSRRAYLVARAAAGLLLLALAVAGGLIGVLVSRQIVRGVDQLSIVRTLVAFGGNFLLFAGFAMIALWISARSHLRSRALGASIGVVVGSFFVNFVSLLFDALEPLGYLSPFHYLNVGNIVDGKPFVGHVVVLAAIPIAAGALARWEFARRDLTR